MGKKKIKNSAKQQNKPISHIAIVFKLRYMYSLIPEFHNLYLNQRLYILNFQCFLGNHNLRKQNGNVWKTLLEWDSSILTSVQFPEQSKSIHLKQESFFQGLSW